MGIEERQTQALPRSGDRPPLENWQQFLRGDPVSILDRLRQDDVLDLYPRCGARIRERALLIEHQRVYDLTMARIAFMAPRLEEPASLEWLEGKIDEAIDHAMRQDQRLEDTGVPPEDDDPNYYFLQEILFMHPLLTRSAAVDFNNVDEADRQVFFFLFEGHSIDEATAAGHGEREEIGAAMRRALFALKYMDPSVKFSKDGRRL